MATYCVGDLAFLANDGNDQGERQKRSLIFFSLLLRRRFLFLSSSLTIDEISRSSSPPIIIG